MFRNEIDFGPHDINPNIDVKDLCYERVKGSDILPKGAQPVDQFDSEPFMMGENGFRRSDISILMSAQSDDLKRSIANRLQEIQVQFPDQSLSDAELAQMAIPRYAQSASGFRDWAASIEKSGFAKSVNEWIDAHKSEEQKSDTIDFTEPNAE